MCTVYRNKLYYQFICFPSLFLQILENLKVNIFFDVPMLHIIESKLLKKPNCIVFQQIAELNLKLNLDEFTIQEDEILKKNWEKFCRVKTSTNDN